MIQDIKTVRPDTISESDVRQEPSNRLAIHYQEMEGSTADTSLFFVFDSATGTTSAFEGLVEENPREYACFTGGGGLQSIIFAVPSATPAKQVGYVRRKIEFIFRKAREEFFEDGIESEFSRSLVSLIEEHGNVAVEILSDFILNDKVDVEAASEALRWVGEIEHLETYRSRLRLLEKSLSCSSGRVRDGAALGLASLDDPHAIPYLKKAIAQETYSELREDLEQVLQQLEKSL